MNWETLATQASDPTPLVLSLKLSLRLRSELRSTENSSIRTLSRECNIITSWKFIICFRKTVCAPYCRTCEHLGLFWWKISTFRRQFVCFLFQFESLRGEIYVFSYWILLVCLFIRVLCFRNIPKCVIVCFFLAFDCFSSLGKKWVLKYSHFAII